MNKQDPIHQQNDINKPKGSTKIFTLSPDSSENIHDLTDDSEEDKIDQCYYLGGIIMNDKKKWSLWLNDQSYTKKMSLRDFEIITVEPHRILVKSKNKTNEKMQHKEKWLSFNQTFCPKINEIYSGDTRHTTPQE